MPGDPTRPALADELRRNGAAVVPGLLDADWCAALCEAIERCRAAPSIHYGVLSPDGAPRVDSDLFRWTDDADLWAVTHESPLVDAACGFVGSERVVLVEDQWFASASGATTPSPWHQDEPYYRLDRPFVTIWVTLDDIDDDQSLRVVPGSHLSGELYGMVEFSARSATITAADDQPVDRPATPGAAADEVLEPVPDIDGDPGRFEVWSWALRAGDAIALDSRTLHATGTATVRSEFRRLSTRWAHPDTRYRHRGSGAAAFWDLLPHGLHDGDPIAGDVFPVVGVDRD